MEWSTIVPSFLGAALGAIAGLASERLKARITGEFWVAQERWRLKRDTYTDLLKALFAQKLGVQKALKLTYLLQSSGADPKAARDEVVKILAEEVGGPARQIRELRVVGALWLRDETLAALDAVDAKLSETALADEAAVQAIGTARAWWPRRRTTFGSRFGAYEVLGGAVSRWSGVAFLPRRRTLQSGEPRIWPRRAPW